MKTPRFSIAGAMIVVAVVALNAAVARAIFAFDPEAVIGIASMGLAVQAMILYLVVRRPSSRAFGISFAVFGMLAMAFFAWGRILPEELIAESFPGQPTRLVNVSWVSSFWLGYGEFVGHQLERWLSGLPILANPDGIAVILLRSVVWSVPQFVVALLGGVVTLGVLKIARSRVGWRGRSPRAALAST